MIGRDRELSLLHEWLAVEPSTAGITHVVLVEGPMGIGKTSVVMAAIARCQQRVVRTRADRLVGNTPLDAARPLIETLLHEDREHVADEASPRAVARRCAAAFDVPTVVLVDDAQWIDDASRAFFAALLAQPAVVPRWFVFVHRPGLMPGDLVAAGRRIGAVIDHLVVEPLEDGAIATLARTLPSPQADEVVRTAGGNPLFARALVSAFRQHPDALDVAHALGPTAENASATIRSAVEADLDTLPEDARLVLQAIAVLDDRDVTAIAAVTGQSRERIDQAMRVLLRRGLLATAPTEALHPVVRSSVYHAADRAWRVHAHRVAAQLPDRDAFTRAEHLALLQEGATVEELTQLTMAAERALGTDPQAVVRWLEPVLAFHPLPRTALLLARALIVCGRPDTATELLRKLIDDADHEAESRVLLGQALRMQSLPDEAREILLASRSREDPALLMELAALAALTDATMPHDILDRLDATPHGQFAVAARAFRTIWLLGNGEIHAARAAFHGIGPALLAAPAEELREVLDAVACAAWSAYLLDDFLVGIQLGELGLRVARRFGRSNVLANLGTAMAYSLVQTGRLDEADEAAETAAEDALRYGTPDLEPMARTLQALSAFWRHDTDLLRHRLEVLRRSAPPSVPWWRRTVESARARTAAMLGEPEPHALAAEPVDATCALRHADAGTIALFSGDQDAARRLFEQGRDLARRQGLESQAVFLGTLLAGVVAGQDRDFAGAVELLEEAQTVYRRLGMPSHLQMAKDNLETVLRAASAAGAARLTSREHQVALLVARGLTNQQIADELVISRRTVEEHVSKVLKKLGVESRSAIVHAFVSRT